jgi:hypothetical protein
MATTGRIQIIFLPSSADVDVETTLTYICTILREIFGMTRDNVVIALEPLHRDRRMAVSVIYDETWRCQIYVNDDKEQVLSDSRNWCNLYGADLSNEDIKEIVKCHRTLDLYCDPDREHIYDQEFEELTKFLQLNFKSRYSFDPSQHSFVISEI